jgi:hypothetical protein
MKKTLKMQLYSEHEPTPQSARLQIEALSNFADGAFRPERCDTAEPLKEAFDPSDLSEPVRWLSQPGADFKFKRSKSFRLEGYISNRHYPKIWTRDTKNGPLIPKVPKRPEPHFLTVWTIWFDWISLRKVGVDVLKQFAIQMFSISKSEYGFLTPESDHLRKNFLVTQLPSGSTSSKFIGTDPQYGVPGVYWFNLFGPKYLMWLGPEIKTVPATVGLLEGGGISLEFGESPEDAESEEVLGREGEAINILGPNKFFDIRQPERAPISPFTYQ